MTRTLAQLRRIAGRLKRKVTGAPEPGERARDIEAARQRLIDRIKGDPSNAAAHVALGDHYLENDAIVSAIAQYRSALAFEKSEAAVQSLARARARWLSSRSAETELANGKRVVAEPASSISAARTDPLLEGLDSTRLQRLNAVATRIDELYHGRHPRVLDVGGGDGVLCLFLPDADYVLAEPAVNGISGTATGLSDDSFDVVLACHVLEHIPPTDRDAFLTQLLRKSKDCLLVLGPYAVQASDRLVDPFIFEITGAEWAAEHITFGLPTLDSLEKFAAVTGLDCSIVPNGDRAAVYWAVFAMHFAQLAGRGDDLRKAFSFFNRHYVTTMSNPRQPNDYRVELHRRRSVESVGKSIGRSS